MADNDIKRTRRREEAEGKDDDPFADLARIVGSDALEEPVRDSPAAGRHSETEPGIEAELLRELDIGADAAEPHSDAPTEEFGKRLAEEITSFQSDDNHRADGVSSSEATADALDSEMLSELLEVDRSDDPVSGAEGRSVDATETPDTEGAKPITGLEAELNAAFVALEQGVSEPLSEAEESGSKDAQPADTEAAQAKIVESEPMAEAYRAFEDDTDAAMPKAAQLDEAADDINDMLLAEMIDVEAEGAGAQATQETLFDPAHIAESDDVPEPIEELHIPQAELDNIVKSPSEENGFSFPLQEELEALASDVPIADAGARHGTETHENWLERRNLDEDVGDPVKAASAAAGNSNDSPHQYHGPLADGGGSGSDDDLAAQEFDVLEDAPRMRRRGVVAALVVLGVALVGGAGFYVWNTGLDGQSASDGPPVIVADNDPVKVKPDNPGGKTVPNQDLAVYDRVAGNASSTTEQQNLVNTTEEPVDVVQRTLSPETLPLEGRANGTETAQKSEDRLAVAGNADDASAADGAPVTGVAPRKVRTLVVKPDGTIVARELPETETAQTTGTGGGSLTAAGTLTAAPGAFGTTVTGEPSTASTLSTPADVAGDDTASGGTLPEADTASDVATTDTQPAADDTAAVPGEEVADAASANAAVAVDSAVGETVATAESAVSDAAPGAASAAPVPVSRPADQTETAADQTETAVVAAATAADTSSAADSPAVSNPGGYLMQISSQPTEAGARQSYETLSQRYASIIGDKGVTFQRADIPDKGIFYRVRIPAGTRAEANDLCNRYKAAGGSCFVAR